MPYYTLTDLGRQVVRQMRREQRRRARVVRVIRFLDSIWTEYTVGEKDMDNDNST